VLRVRGRHHPEHDLRQDRIARARILLIEGLGLAALLYYLSSPLRFPVALWMLPLLRLVAGLAWGRPSRDAYIAVISLLPLLVLFDALKMYSLAEKSAWAAFLILLSGFILSVREARR